MSGTNWLERNPKESAGLTRIREVEAQVVAQQENERRFIEKIEAERLAAKREHVRQETLIQQTEDKLSTLTPILEEIKNFANQTGTYPLGLSGISGIDGDLVVEPQPQLIQQARLAKGREEDKVILILKYGYRGKVPKYEDQNIDPDHGPDPRWVGDEEAILYYGIKLSGKVDSPTIELIQQTEELVPEVKAGWVGHGRSSGWQDGHGAYRKLNAHSIPLAEGGEAIRRQLADAFHNPVYLHTEKLSLSNPERVSQSTKSQENTELASFAKSLLGLK